MKKCLLILLIAISLVDTVYAALPIKQSKDNLIEENATQTLAVNANFIPSTKDNKPPEDNKKKKPHHSRRYYEEDLPGWPGIVAISCCLAILFYGWAPALIFGFIGLDRRYKNRGLAIAAIVISIAYIIAFIVLMLAYIGLL